MNNYIILLFCLFSSISLYSQQNWFEENSKWTYGVGDFWSGGTFGYEEITVEGEIEILGKLCKKLNKVTFVRDSSNEIVISDKTVEYVYQNNDTIYHLIGSDFSPIYNFNLAEGDTSQLITDSILGRNLYYKIDSIRDIEINHQILRTQYVSTWDTQSSNYNYNLEIIEKIGPREFYLFTSQMIVLAVPDAVYKIPRCYQDDSLEINLTLNQIPCDNLPMLTHTSELKKSNQLLIAPNPFKENFNILFDISEIKSIEVFDLNGKSVIKSKENFNHIGTEIEANGIYFLKIILNSNKIIIENIVKI